MLVAVPVVLFRNRHAGMTLAAQKGRVLNALALSGPFGTAVTGVSQGFGL